MKGVRITGGELRGRRLRAAGKGTRPTTARTREAFFNIVGERISSGGSFLDLFAGTGVMSFEAVSRGASRVVSVERDRAAARRLEATAAEWETPIEVLREDVYKVLLRADAGWDIVYADPPWDFDRWNRLLERLGAFSGVDGSTIVAIEHPSRHALESERGGLRLSRSASWGDTAISFYERTTTND